jgi:hypothetical protein
MAKSISPVPPGRVASFRLWHYPAAGPQYSWAIFVRRIDAPDAGSALVRRLVWDRDADFERLELGGRLRPTEEPLLELFEGPLDEAPLSALMRDAAWITLPDIRMGPRRFLGDRAEFGLDGFDRKALDGTRSVIQVAWDRNPPLQLEAIDVWSGRVRAWLRQSVC